MKDAGDVKHDRRQKTSLSVGNNSKKTGGSKNDSTRQLLQEKQRNRFLQLEIERLQKSIETYKKTIQQKSLEIESKNKVINKLIEDKTNSDYPGETIEDIDIDNLLRANLDEASLTTIINGEGFEDLNDLNLTNLEIEETLPFDYLDSLAVNANYIIDEHDDGVDNDEVVQQMVIENREGFGAISKVSPIKISRDRRPSGSTTYQVKDSARKKKGSSLSCSHCSKQFPLGGQWKLQQHLTNVHPLSCPQCKKVMGRKSCLTAHLESHKHTNPWQCSKCKMTCNNLTQFVSHVKNVHKVNKLTDVKEMLRSPSIGSEYLKLL